jgi:CRISPR-associated protein Csb2
MEQVIMTRRMVMIRLGTTKMTRIMDRKLGPKAFRDQNSDTALRPCRTWWMSATNHRHAQWLPLDLDGDGRIDHVVVHAKDGLDAEAQEAIARIDTTWGKDLPTIVVSLVGSGEKALFARQLRNRSGSSCAELGHGAIWTSRTPFVAPRFRKKSEKNNIVGQVIAECAARGLATPQVEVLPRSAMMDASFLAYVRHRRPGHPQPPDTSPWALRLTFPGSINGPLSLGYGSHFGLGLFAAVDE